MNKIFLLLPLFLLAACDEEDKLPYSERYQLKAIQSELAKLNETMAKIEAKIR